MTYLTSKISRDLLPHTKIATTHTMAQSMEPEFAEEPSKLRQHKAWNVLHKWTRITYLAAKFN